MPRSRRNLYYYTRFFRRMQWEYGKVFGFSGKNFPFINNRDVSLCASTFPRYAHANKCSLLYSIISPATATGMVESFHFSAACFGGIFGGGMVYWYSCGRGSCEGDGRSVRKSAVLDHEISIFSLFCPALSSTRLWREPPPGGSLLDSADLRFSLSRNDGFHLSSFRTAPAPQVFAVQSRQG